MSDYNVNTTVLLPNGSQLITYLEYGNKEHGGISVLVAISSMSLVAVVGLLLLIGFSAFKTRSSLDQHLFIRTHCAAYFISLLLMDLLQATGSLMNARWIAYGGVTAGDYCTVQAIIKTASDVGTAFWTFAIALHTFFLLFLKIKPSTVVLWGTLVSGWSAIIAILLVGPTTRHLEKRGPFYTVSGYWCWISPNFPRSRVVLDYMLMFITAFLCFVLYSLLFLRLRGNIELDGYRWKFRRVSKAWGGIAKASDQTMLIAKQMLLYPIAYTVLVVPMAACRFARGNIPFEATIFSAAIFLLSGLVNVSLFMAISRSCVPVRLNKSLISAPKLNVTPADAEEGNIGTETIDPYYSNHTFCEEDEAAHEITGTTDLPIIRPPSAIVARDGIDSYYAGAGTHDLTRGISAATSNSAIIGAYMHETSPVQRGETIPEGDEHSEFDTDDSESPSTSSTASFESRIRSIMDEDEDHYHVGTDDEEYETDDAQSVMSMEVTVPVVPPTNILPRSPIPRSPAPPSSAPGTGTPGVDDHLPFQRR